MRLKRRNKIIVLFIGLISLNVFPIFFITPPINFEGSWKYFLGEDDILNIPVAISNDGNYIVVGGPQDKVYFFESSNPIPSWSYRCNNEIRDVDISADGSYIAVATDIDYKIYLFHRSSPNPLWSSTTGFPLKEVDLSYNGDYIVAAADQLYLFEKSSEIPLWTFADNHNQININTARISSDGNWIVAGNDEIFYFGKSSSTPLWIYDDNTGSTLDFSSNGEFIVLGGSDGVILLNSAVESPKTAVWTYGPMLITDLGISSDGDEIIAGRSAGGFLFFENRISTPTSTGNTLSRGNIAISPEGNYFVIGCINNNLYVFIKDQSDPTLSFYLDNPVKDVSISSNGNCIAATTSNHLNVIFRDNPIFSDVNEPISIFFLISLGVALSIDAIIGIRYLIKRRLKSVDKEIELKREGKVKESSDLMEKLDETFEVWEKEKDKKEKI